MKELSMVFFVIMSVLSSYPTFKIGYITVKISH